jgi:hypothetical protein
MSDFEKWQSGEELNYAFDHFADPYQREQFRIARSLGAMETISHLMFADLFDRLASSELQALGFQTSPAVIDGPVPIPTHCFMQRPNISHCEADEIIASGFRYERVRVVKPSKPEISLDVATPPAQSEKRNLGRPSTYPAARDALRALYKANPESILKPAARLLEAFNAQYLRHAELHGLQIAALSERVLRDHLTLFRQELAETSKNLSAN